MSRKSPVALGAAALACLTGIFGAAAPTFAATVSYGNASVGHWWMPAPVSSLAASIDSLFALVMWICLGLAVLVLGLLTFSIMRWRVATDGPMLKGAPIHGNNALEIGWTIGPFIIVGIILYAGWGMEQKLNHAPPGAPTIAVEGYQWGWRFSHDGIKEDAVLHIPVGQPFKLALTSPDVIHEFFVPAMRVGEDIVPGMTTWTWIEANKPGKYLVECNEFCGVGHAYMRGEIIAMPQKQYEAWLAANKPSK